MNRNGSVHKTAALHQMNEFVPRYGPNYEYVGLANATIRMEKVKFS